MKSTGNETLNEYLNTAREIQCCDLYEITLNGTAYYFTNSDRDIVYDSKTYRHNVYLFERNEIKLENQLQVDSLTVTITAGEDDTITIGGKTKKILKAVNDGNFDGARLKLSRCFFKPRDGASLPSIVGVIVLFTGYCDIAQAGGMYVQLDVKSKATGLGMNFPIRRYYPQGAYTSASDGSISASTDTKNCVIAPFIPQKEVLI